MDGLPTAAQVDPLIHERASVAQQYWTVTRPFQHAPLGFKTRLQVAFGRFTACSPGGTSNGGGSGGERYQIFTTWDPVGVPPPEQARRLQEAVPVVERAFNDAGWSQFQPSASNGLEVVATRQGITLALDADPANPAPLERDWTPTENYTVTGPCIPVISALAATEVESVADDYYGTVTTTLPSIQIQTRSTQ